MESAQLQFMQQLAIASAQFAKQNRSLIERMAEASVQIEKQYRSWMEQLTKQNRSSMEHIVDQLAKLAETCVVAQPMMLRIAETRLGDVKLVESGREGPAKPRKKIGFIQ